MARNKRIDGLDRLIHQSAKGKGAPAHMIGDRNYLESTAKLAKRQDILNDLASNSDIVGFELNNGNLVYLYKEMVGE